MDEHLEDLDDGARLALEVAMGAAAALGDHQCGTEYLLYGLFATASGELSEIADLFALGALRMERAVQKLREPYMCDGSVYDGDPVYSTRALGAMRTRRHDGTGPTGVFELLFGILQDSRSGACAVLRELGVRPEEVHRLAAYGRRHLSREEAQVLLEALDRRDKRRAQPWWGPAPESIGGPDDTTLAPLTFGGERSIEIGRSQTTIAAATDLAVGQDGFAITLIVESLRPWVLNPVIDPPEILIPGFASARRLGPEVLRFELVFSDGERVSSLTPGERWRHERPNRPVILALETRTESVRTSDRRSHDCQRVMARYWVWPIPAPGTVELRVEWPAEVLSGLTSFDGRELVDASQALSRSDLTSF